MHENGVMLSDQEGLKGQVVEFFSLFHDCQRFSEHEDSLHGLRGAELAYELREHVSLNDDDFELLSRACRLHTHAKTDIDLTVQVCFDADRLDLGRVGNKPIAELLCSPMAKKQETIEWAYQKSLDRRLPRNAFGLSADDVKKLMER